MYQEQWNSKKQLMVLHGISWKEELPYYKQIPTGTKPNEVIKALSR